MITQPWQAAITRWGDPVFRLALLLTDTPAAAEEATVQAFTRALSAEHADLETALYTHLLNQRSQPRWQRLARLFQGRSSTRLPRALTRVAPQDRALLGLWLLRDVTGTRLATISRMPETALAARMADTLIRLLPLRALGLAQSNAATDQPDLAAFQTWLRHKLGLDSASPVHLASDEQHAAERRWQAALDELRLQLRGALDDQRLPLTCSEAIEINLLTHQAGGPPQWWERPAVWTAGAVAGAMLLLLWLIVPGDSSSASTSTELPLAQQTPQEIVQQALNAWTTQPISGTIQRTVWAVPPQPPPTLLQPSPRQRAGREPQPQTTDVWLEAGSARYRLEVHSGDQLIEWQAGDGSKLEYAAVDGSTGCAWGDSGTSDSEARTFDASAEEQRAVLAARLTQGAYGQGYHALHAALSASDLHSFGTRREGKDVLLALSYTDRSAAEERKRLLWIDTATGELRIVQELPASGAGGSARDLWRLQQRQVLPFGIPRARPAWSQPFLKVDRPLLDPACPGLDESHVISLRQLVDLGRGYSPQLVPQPLPADTTRAALITSSLLGPENSGLPPDIRLIVLGNDRWLRISKSGRGLLPSQSTARGRLLVNVSQSGPTLTASVCEPLPDSSSCWQTLSLAARGWKEDELLALIDTLTPLTMENWAALDDLFLDPAPLDPAVHKLLQDAFRAAQQPDGKVLHAIGERSAYIVPSRSTRQDPYVIPPEQLSWARLTEEQWQVFSGTETIAYSSVIRIPDGSPLVAWINDDTLLSEYHRSDGRVRIKAAHRQNDSEEPPQTPASEMLTVLVERSLPITLTTTPDALVLEQTVRADREALEMVRAQFSQLLFDQLGTGQLISRVTFDPKTSLPRQLQQIHVAPDGKQTLLVELTLREWRVLDQPAPAEAFQMPSLPDETIVVDERAPGGPRIVSGRIDIPPQPRQLVWPDGSGVELIDQHGPQHTASDGPVSDRQLVESLGLEVDSLEMSDFVQTSRYRLPGSETRVVLRQGPRDLLRHQLRYPDEGANNLIWLEQSSKPISVTVAGQERTAWLIVDQYATLLVVEVDETLVLLSGPSDAVIERDVVPLLPLLRWEPRQGQS